MSEMPAELVKMSRHLADGLRMLDEIIALTADIQRNGDEREALQKRIAARFEQDRNEARNAWGLAVHQYCEEIGDLQEQIQARDYVIGALKTQVRDSQQAGMALQQERFQLFQIANAFAHGMTEEWEKTGVCQAALKDWQGFVAREQELNTARERLAAYANAGRVVEGMDSNIPD
jgi:hypothetical protein